ncbi:MAG: O-antigen ligase family protein [Candidatus Omnitrophota bacterium]|jgi:O-antigen ligase
MWGISFVRNVRFVATLWAIYFFCVFTFGRLEQWTRFIIWVGGGVVVLGTLFAKGLRRRDIPNEALFIVAFLGWSFLGWMQARDLQAYNSYFKLCFEMLMVVAFLGAIVRKNGSLNVFWWSFIATAIFNTVAPIMEGSFSIGGEAESVARTRGLLANPNALAFLCFLGVLGALALIGDKRSSPGVKVVAIAGSVVAFWGLIAAGSRGGYLAFTLAIILWPLMCVGSWKRRKWRSIFFVLATVVAMCYVSLWVQENTNLGKRVERAAAGEDGSANERHDLILVGLKITKDHPLIGVGLGQFGLVSKTGVYAHNEWIELLATTGIPGFLFFMSIYVSAWRRLKRTLKYTHDPIIRYRIKFAMMTLIILVVAGAVFRPNFLNVDTIFLIAMVVGISHWAEDTVMPKPALKRHHFLSAKQTSTAQYGRGGVSGIEKSRMLDGKAFR